MEKSPIHQIGDILHKSFRVAQGGIGDISGIIGASQPSGDMRKKLFSALAAIQNEPSEKHIQDFYAQIQVARTLGMLDESAEHTINLLLEEIEWH